MREGAWAWWLRFGRCRAGWVELGGTFGKDRFCMCGGTEGKGKDGGAPAGRGHCRLGAGGWFRLGKD